MASRGAITEYFVERYWVKNDYATPHDRDAGELALILRTRYRGSPFVNDDYEAILPEEDLQRVEAEGFKITQISLGHREGVVTVRLTPKTARRLERKKYEEVLYASEQ